MSGEPRNTTPSNLSRARLSCYFWTFVAVYMLIWTIVPTFGRPILSDDMIEAVTWGQQFCLGYDKNPWLPGWLAHFGILIAGPSGLGIYFIQTAFIASGFYAVWRLGKYYANAVMALVAVLMYVGCICYTVELQIFNDNYILMGLLPFASLLFYRAIHTEQWRYWLSAAAVTALAVMGKYDAVLFAISMLLYFLCHPKRWHYVTSAKTWAALAIFLLIITPNFIWLSQHHFSTLHYAFDERAGFQQTRWLSQVKDNLRFMAETGMSFLPALILLGIACFPPQKASLADDHRHDRLKNNNDLLFLFWVSFGPLLLLLVLGFSMGLSLHREWGNTFTGLWGLFLLVSLQPCITLAALKRFMTAAFFLLLLTPTVYLYINWQKDNGSYPAERITTIVIKTWQDNFHTPLRYVAGDRYTAGYIGLYAKSQPAVWTEWNTRAASWIHEADVRCHGAVFIQDSGHTRQQFFSGMQFPPQVIKQFPTLRVLSPISVPWLSNHTHRADLQILIGLLPPDAAACEK